MHITNNLLKTCEEKNHKAARKRKRIAQRLTDQNNTDSSAAVRCEAGVELHRWRSGQHLELAVTYRVSGQREEKPHSHLNSGRRNIGQTQQPLHGKSSANWEGRSLSVIGSTRETAQPAPCSALEERAPGLQRWRGRLRGLLPALLQQRVSHLVT